MEKKKRKYQWYNPRMFLRDKNLLFFINFVALILNSYFKTKKKGLTVCRLVLIHGFLRMH